MELVPLREVMESNHRELRERLNRIEGKLDHHSHNDKVSWTAFVPILITLIVAAGLLS